MANLGYLVCYPFAALLRLFYNLTNSYGLSLILFTLVIKLVMLPFQIKSKKSMMRVTRMNGRMQEIQRKYANNQIKMNQEMQKLYEEEGANPMSGCLWSFLPLPIMIALYSIIREPIKYFMNFGSLSAGTAVLESAKKVVTGLGLTWSTIEKTGADSFYAQIEIVKHLANNADKPAVQSFFEANPNWINVNYDFLGIDLSIMPTQAFAMLKTGITWAACGLILMPIISAVLSWMVSKVSMSSQPDSTASINASNKMMIWMMPAMSLYIGLTLPAALCVYWIAQSAFSYVQELLMNKVFKSKFEAEEEAHQRQVEERRRQRQEEARRLQEEQRQLSARQQAAAKKKADAARKTGPKNPTTEAGRVGDRPYARGRAFSETHYPDETE